MSKGACLPRVRMTIYDLLIQNFICSRQADIHSNPVCNNWSYFLKYVITLLSSETVIAIEDHVSALLKRVRHTQFEYCTLTCNTDFVLGYFPTFHHCNSTPKNPARRKISEISFTKPSYSRFCLKFCCHGNRGHSGENHTIEPKISTLSCVHPELTD